MPGVVVNNGQKVYTLLVQMSTLTGMPTGVVKPNVPGDPDYLPPVSDPIGCPTGDVQLLRDIIVEQIGGFTNFTVKIFAGLQQESTTFLGPWTVLDRPYDGVIFTIPVPPAQQYKLRVYYGTAQVAEISPVTGGNFLLPGPFPEITKLQMYAQVGDYSDDFSNDFSG